MPSIRIAKDSDRIEPRLVDFQATRGRFTQSLRFSIGSPDGSGGGQKRPGEKRNSATGFGINVSADNILSGVRLYGVA